MNFKFLTNDQLMLWFTLFITLLFFVGGVFEVLDNIMIKFILFCSISFLVSNIYFVLFKDENKKSPENDSE